MERTSITKERPRVCVYCRVGSAAQLNDRPKPEKISKPILLPPLMIAPGIYSQVSRKLLQSLNR